MPTVYPSLAGGREIRSFSRRDTILDTAKAAGIGSVFGINVVLLRNSLSASRTMLGGFRGKMGIVAVYALVGGAYAFAESASANLREKETALNAFAGGAAAGAVVGTSLRSSVAKTLGGAVILGSVAAAFEWGFDRGRSFALEGSDTKETVLTPEHPRQGFWELVHRRPLTQTIEDLGDLAKQFLRD